MTSIISSSTILFSTIVTSLSNSHLSVSLIIQQNPCGSKGERRILRLAFGKGIMHRAKSRTLSNSVFWIFVYLIAALPDLQPHRPDLRRFCPVGRNHSVGASSRWQSALRRTAPFIFQIQPSQFLQNKKDIHSDVLFVLEVPARFELANESFADSCLTTWPRYHLKKERLLCSNRSYGAGDEARNEWCSPVFALARQIATGNLNLNIRAYPAWNKSNCIKHLHLIKKLERVTRLELATSTLARWRSTG